MGAQAGRSRSLTTGPNGPRVLVGFSAGLIPNAVIFAALFSTPWVDDHVYDWLAVGVLYAWSR